MQCILLQVYTEIYMQCTTVLSLRRCCDVYTRKPEQINFIIAGYVFKFESHMLGLNINLAWLLNCALRLVYQFLLHLNELCSLHACTKAHIRARN